MFEKLEKLEKKPLTPFFSLEGPREVIPDPLESPNSSEVLEVKPYSKQGSPYPLVEVKAGGPGFVVGPGAVKVVEYPADGIRFLESYGASVCCIAVVECSSGNRSAVFHVDPWLDLDASIGVGQEVLASFVDPKVSLFQGACRKEPDWRRLHAVEDFFCSVTDGKARFWDLRATFDCENIVYDLESRRIFDGVATRISQQKTAERFKQGISGPLERV